MIEIGKHHREAMMKQTSQYTLKTILHGDKGVFEEYLPDSIIGQKVKSFGFSNILGAYTIAGNINYNKSEDKMEVTPVFYGYDNYSLINRFRIDGIKDSGTQWNRISMIQLERRIQIIATLALSAVFNDSKAAGFSNTQKAANRHFWIHGHHVSEFVQDKIEMTGKFDVDFKNAFRYLWFAYPGDLTGHDKNIIKVTLEEGLLETDIGLKVRTHT